MLRLPHTGQLQQVVLLLVQLPLPKRAARHSMALYPLSTTPSPLPIPLIIKHQLLGPSQHQQCCFLLYTCLMLGHTPSWGQLPQEAIAAAKRLWRPCRWSRRGSKLLSTNHSTSPSINHQGTCLPLPLPLPSLPLPPGTLFQHQPPALMLPTALN
jgi:hypothetical protein